jgi:hydrogenase maturation protease
MPQTLVIGFGNLDRGDDGAALHVVNRLRARMGRQALAEGNTGLEELGSETAVFIRQLLPELSPEVDSYDRLVFVDAHLPGNRRLLECETVRPEPLRSTFSHVLPPGAFLWLVQAIYGRVPEAFVVSLQGHSFEVTRELTPATAGLVVDAAEKIWQLLHPNMHCGKSLLDRRDCNRKGYT